MLRTNRCVPARKLPLTPLVLDLLVYVAPCGHWGYPHGRWNTVQKVIEGEGDLRQSTKIVQFRVLLTPIFYKDEKQLLLQSLYLH